MRQHIRSPLADKSIDDLFPNRAAWDRFRRNKAFSAALKGLRTLENSKFNVELWGHVGKEFFENNFPDPGGNERKKFNQDLESQLGTAKWRFWAYAYLLYESLLSEEATVLKKGVKGGPETHDRNQTQYRKAMRILLRLHKKGYIIFPYPFFITEKKPVISGTLKEMLRKKEGNVFVYFMVGIPLNGLSRNKAADLLWYFFGAYLPALMIHDACDDEYGTIEWIKKAAIRPPF